MAGALLRLGSERDLKPEVARQREAECTEDQGGGEVGWDVRQAAVRLKRAGARWEDEVEGEQWNEEHKEWIALPRRGEIAVQQGKQRAGGTAARAKNAEGLVDGAGRQQLEPRRG